MKMSDAMLIVSGVEKLRMFPSGVGKKSACVWLRPEEVTSGKML